MKSTYTPKEFEDYLLFVEVSIKPKLTPEDKSRIKTIF